MHRQFWIRCFEELWVIWKLNSILLFIINLKSSIPSNFCLLSSTCKLLTLVTFSLVGPQKSGFYWVAQQSQQCWDWYGGHFYDLMVGSHHEKNHWEIQTQCKDIAKINPFQKFSKMASSWGRFEAEVKTLSLPFTITMVVTSTQSSAQQSQQLRM